MVHNAAVADDRIIRRPALSAVHHAVKENLASVIFQADGVYVPYREIAVNKVDIILQVKMDGGDNVAIRNRVVITSGDAPLPAALLQHAQHIMLAFLDDHHAQRLAVNNDPLVGQEARVALALRIGAGNLISFPRRNVKQRFDLLWNSIRQRHCSTQGQQHRQHQQESFLHLHPPLSCFGKQLSPIKRRR